VRCTFNTEMHAYGFRFLELKSVIICPQFYFLQTTLQYPFDALHAL
jgi:hypothetical protein